MIHVTMVKKLLDGGRACDKCVQAEQLLKSKGLWGNIHEVVWAVDGDPTSPGMALAAQKGVRVAPFFVVRDDAGQERVYESVLRFVKECLAPSPVVTKGGEPHSDRVTPATPATLAQPLGAVEVESLAARLGRATPLEIMDWVLERYGSDCALAFSGAEDVMLIDLAKRTGRPFSVFCLDTGRLHPETYEFIERVREHYAIAIEVVWPKAVSVEGLVRNKGLFSFYDDGHDECCSIRKVEPLGRALAHRRAWATGQRRDQSPTRSDVSLVELDTAHLGLTGPLLKVNPLAALSRDEVWHYLHQNGVPYNPLHDRGFASIGCAPCTRAVRPGEHERAGRWWWEDATQRECGLHVASRQS